MTTRKGSCIFVHNIGLLIPASAFVNARSLEE